MLLPSQSLARLALPPTESLRNKQIRNESVKSLDHFWMSVNFAFVRWLLRTKASPWSELGWTRCARTELWGKTEPKDKKLAPRGTNKSPDSPPTKRISYHWGVSNCREAQFRWSWVHVLPLSRKPKKIQLLQTKVVTRTRVWMHVLGLNIFQSSPIHSNCPQSMPKVPNPCHTNPKIDLPKNLKIPTCSSITIQDQITKTLGTYSNQI